MKFKTDNILHTLFDIAIGGRDIEIRKKTKGAVGHFPDLEQAGTIAIYFDKNRNKYPRDSAGRFASHEQNLVGR